MCLPATNSPVILVLVILHPTSSSCQCQLTPTPASHFSLLAGLSFELFRLFASFLRLWPLAHSTSGLIVSRWPPLPEPWHSHFSCSNLCVPATCITWPAVRRLLCQYPISPASFCFVWNLRLTAHRPFLILEKSFVIFTSGRQIQPFEALWLFYHLCHKNDFKLHSVKQSISFYSTLFSLIPINKNLRICKTLVWNC